MLDNEKSFFMVEISSQIPTSTNDERDILFEKFKDLFKYHNIKGCIRCSSPSNYIGGFVPIDEIQRFWPSQPDHVFLLLHLACHTCKDLHADEIAAELIACAEKLMGIINIDDFHPQRVVH